MTADVQALAKDWDKAFNRGDLRHLAGFYAPDARVVPAGGTPIDGAVAAGEFFAGLRASGLTEHEIDARSVVARGDTLIATGTWKLSGANANGERLQLGGNWINVLGRHGDAWKILLHCWN